MLQSFALKPGDLIVSMMGTIGFIVIIPENIQKGIMDSHLLRLRIDETRADKRFVFHAFRSKLIQNQIDALSVGTIMSGLSSKIIKMLQLPLPSLQEQYTIAKILSDLDSKIELNQNMNKTLEAIGQAIFKHWFVDFEFPNEEGKPYKFSGGEMVYNEELGKEIPKGWEVDLLSNHVQIKGRIGWKGLKISEYVDDGPFIVTGIDIYSNIVNWENCKKITNERYDESPEIMLDNNDILMTKDGTIGKLAFIYKLPGKATVAAHIHVIKIKSANLLPLYLFYFFKTKGFTDLVTSRISGTVIPSITQKDINNIQIPLPSKIIITKFDTTINSIFLKLMENKLSIKNLQQIHGSLLPKLMSGKIRAPAEAN